MNWDKAVAVKEKGELVFLQTLVIISASSPTDILTFYADLCFERGKSGYVKLKNPFKGTLLYVSFKKTRAVVFWTKNPKPMFRHLDVLDEHCKNYYFQINKDIGEYNTCLHNGIYCYVSTSKKIAIQNYKSHTVNPNAETITEKKYGLLL